MSDLASLIARLEAAEGPSRELDAEIWRALGNGVFYSNETQPQPCDKDTGNYLPLLTASLDSALSLVPEGVWTTIDHYFMSDERPDIWRVWLKRPIGFDGKRPKIIEYFSKAPTPALALTAAALKARAQG